MLLPSFIPNLYLRDHTVISIIYKSGGEEKQDSQHNETKDTEQSLKWEDDSETEKVDRAVEMNARLQGS